MILYYTLVTNISIQKEELRVLVWFRCKNFASFKDDTILDMRAVKAYKEHPYNLIAKENKQDSLLKVVSIYGANASGKTNFVGAFINFRDIILNSFQQKNKEEQKSVLAQNYFPFLLSADCYGNNTEFEIVTQDDTDEYQYGFAYNNNIIEEEWLYRRSLSSSRTTTILERSKQSIVLGSSVKKSFDKYTNAIDKDVLALSLYSSLSFRNNAFTKTLNNIKDIGAIDSSERREKLLLDSYFKYVYNEKEKHHLLSFLNAIDVGIVDIRVDYNNNNQKYEVYFLHEDENGKKKRFHINIESAGTIKAVSLYSVMRLSAKLNKPLIIDELNTKLHPLLQKYLIDLFYEGTESGQLIYTTHDTTLLDKKFMRRDQVWFVEKNKKGESSMYSLADFKVRNDSSFEKDYLAGVYGGIPILKDYSFVEE